MVFAGLAPTLAGLYQMNVQVPTGVGPGNVYLEVVTDAADVLQIQVPVGGSAAAAVTAEDRTATHRPHVRPMNARKRSARDKARTNAIH
ncbi:MAG: hypothetical protein ABSB35_37565 [Bryobacteraceae bacterium]